MRKCIKYKSCNKVSKPTAGRARCGLNSCYVDARTGALRQKKDGEK